MKPLSCPRAPLYLWTVSLIEYFLFLINSLTISGQCSIYVETRLFVCTLNILTKLSSPPSLLAINFVKMENIHFSNRPHVGHLIKGSCLGASYTKTAPCLVWCRYIFCRLRYVFYLSRDPTKPLRWDAMHIYGWELLAACHHPEEFGDHRHSDSKRKNASSKTWIS